MNIRELLLEGSHLIGQGGKSETAWLDASLLLCNALKLDRSQIIARLNEPIAEKLTANYTEIRENFLSSCQRRATGLPVAYLTGVKEFYGREFLVDQSVLIPRPETEILIEWVIETARRPAQERQILDCFTGSGCIAISLALELGTNVEACDLSPAALAKANQNCLLHCCADKVNFQRADLIDGYQFEYGEFDIITANPPYVPSLESQAALGQGWGEPLIALDGGDDGLDLIRRFLPQAWAHLKPGGRLFMEFGDGQSSRILELLRQTGFQDFSIRTDLAGIDRIVCAG